MKKGAKLYIFPAALFRARLGQVARGLRKEEEDQSERDVLGPDECALGKQLQCLQALVFRVFLGHDHVELVPLPWRLHDDGVWKHAADETRVLRQAEDPPEDGLDLRGPGSRAAATGKKTGRGLPAERGRR